MVLQSDNSRSPLSLMSSAEPCGPMLDGIPLLSPWVHSVWH